MKRGMTTPPVASATGSKQQAIQEALALHREGKHELAMQRYVAILQQDPGNLDALYYVAMIALQQGQIEEGLKVIGRAIVAGPPQARLHNLKGQAHLRLNQDDDALKSFGRAIEIDPAFPDAYGNRATLLSEMGRAAQAIADYDRALELRPANAEDHCNRASAMADLGRLDEALAGFARAISLVPAMAPAYFNRADVLLRIGRPVDALRDCDQAIKLYPELAGAHCTRGLALKALGRLDEARASLDQALKLDPNLSDAFVNRANVALQQGRFDDAKADYQRALEARPELAEASHGQALACLYQGDWATGFELYEARDKMKEPAFKPLPYPRWTADSPASEKLVLLCEQGLGDMIQFSRFAPLLAARGHDVTLLAPDSMRPLLSTLAGVTVAPISDAPAMNGKPMRWLPLMSAPGALDVRPDSVPGKVPYLAAEPQRVERWGAWLGGSGFKIGINWSAGAARDWFAHQRDIPLAAFAPLLEIPDVRLISLQKGPAAAAIANAAFRNSIEVPDADPNPGADFFLDTAALMTNLDLIVTCDTSVPHLAGALARPVFTALPHLANWRWLRDRDDTPWYPTMRLFRQSTPQSWSDVFARIATAVAAMAKASAQNR
jgi:tetratricopeptide (TPR) repeat protein